MESVWKKKTEDVEMEKKEFDKDSFSASRKCEHSTVYKNIINASVDKMIRIQYDKNIGMNIFSNRQNSILKI